MRLLLRYTLINMINNYNILGAMDKNVRKMRGSRDPRDITIETYTDSNEKPLPLLPQSHGSRASKSQSTSRENSEEKSSISTSVADSSKGATACNVSADQINFISGNPFVEVTKGILHLFKEKYVYILLYTL